MAAPTVDVQRGSQNQSSATVDITSSSFTTTGPNRVLVAVVTCNIETSAAVTTSSIVDALGLTWTQQFAHTMDYTITNAIHTHCSIWTAVMPSAGNIATITAHFSGTPNQASIDVFAIAGCFSTSAPFDNSLSNFTFASDLSGSSTTPTVSMSTLEANDLIIAVQFGGRNAPAAVAPFTNLIQRTMGFDFPTTYFVETENHAVTTIQSPATATTTPATQFWGMVIFALSADTPNPVPHPRSFGLAIS